jgi:putative transposase
LEVDLEEQPGRSWLLIRLNISQSLIQTPGSDRRDTRHIQHCYRFSTPPRDELTGGGLIRSLRGWTEAREALKGGVHVMSDERILGDSDFVDSIISQSDEHYERRHKLRRQGYDLRRIAERVSVVLGIKPDEVLSKGRQGRKVNARSLLCFWAARELGMSHTALAKALEMSLAGVGFSVESGESIARKGNYSLE